MLVLSLFLLYSSIHIVTSSTEPATMPSSVTTTLLLLLVFLPPLLLQLPLNVTLVSCYFPILIFVISRKAQNLDD